MFAGRMLGVQCFYRKVGGASQMVHSRFYGIVIYYLRQLHFRPQYAICSECVLVVSVGRRYQIR